MIGNDYRFITYSIFDIEPVNKRTEHESSEAGYLLFVLVAYIIMRCAECYI